MQLVVAGLSCVQLPCDIHMVSTATGVGFDVISKDISSMIELALFIRDTPASLETLCEELKEVILFKL